MESDHTLIIAGLSNPRGRDRQMILLITPRIERPGQVPKTDDIPATEVEAASLDTV